MLSHDAATFLDTLIVALIPAIPLAVGLLITWLRAKENTSRIDNRPTRDQVGTAIDQKIQELGIDGSTTGTDVSGHAAGAEQPPAPGSPNG